MRLEPCLRHARFLPFKFGILSVIIIVITTWRLKRGPFQPLKSDSQKSGTSSEKLHLSGFMNTGDVGNMGCDDLRQTGDLDIEQSIPLHDNISQIALSLSSHPMIQDTVGQSMDSTEPFELERLVGRCLSQFAGSGVWLPQLDVYIVISRVVYTAPGTSWPTISFLRGRIFDKDWRHLENYTIDWYGKKTIFPTVFEIPTIWWKSGSFFGPEDPRIVLEEGVQGAEPIVVFNMILNVTGHPRAMWILKPFSNFISHLTIQGEERKSAEKNWAPFFYRDPDDDLERKPSKYLHFIYSFNPLQVLKCTFDNGSCAWLYRQTIPESLSLPHQDAHGEMRGGTNFVPIPIRGHSSPQLYVGFPRTHVQFCKSGPSYRPELVLLSGFGSNFHVAYSSVATDFGNAILDRNELRYPCTSGAFLLPISVLRWDHDLRKDAMTLLFSVGDKSIRVIRLFGMLRFIQSLPYVANSISHKWDHDKPLQNFRWSMVGKEVIACAVETAANSSHKDSIEMEMEELQLELKSLEDKETGLL